MNDFIGLVDPPEALECADPVCAYECAILLCHGVDPLADGDGSHIRPTGSAYSKLQRGCSTPERYARPRHPSWIVGLVKNNKGETLGK